MTQRMTAVRSAADLIAQHQRFAGDTLYGTRGTLPNGLLAELGATSNVMTFLVPGSGPYTITVDEGAPERESGWHSAPGSAVVLPEMTIYGDPGGTDTVATGDGGRVVAGPDGLAVTSPPPSTRRSSSSDALALLAIVGVVVAILALGK